MQPHRRQPTRLPCPWDSPGNNTGVGCHFLLQCMKVESQSEVAQLCLTLTTPWTAAHQAPLSMGFPRQEYWSGVPSPVANQASLPFTIFQSLLKLMSVESVMPSNHLILCHPLLINLSQHSLFQWVSSPYQVAKVLELQLQHQSFQWIVRLIPFRNDWFDLLTVQGTLKSILQHHSSKASVLWCSAFFIFQLSQPYMTTGKIIALNGQTFVDKVMSLLFNMLSMLVITFLPRSKCLLISWLQTSSAVILEPKK